MSTRTKCTGCESDKLHLFLDLGESPIADAYTENVDDESTMYPLQVAVCENCQLVQLLEVVDSQALFGTGYSFYSSASPPLSAYHKQYAEYILEHYGHLARRLVIEIGCNDGDMLRWMNAAGCPHLGVDPADGPVAAAQEQGLNVVRSEFTSRLAEEIWDWMKPAGVIIANHVLAHVENVADILRGISLLLASDGVAFIEVQYLPDLLVNNAFDLIYHEHRNFFSLTSLMSLVEAWGLRVVDARLTRRQGGSLRATLRKVDAEHSRHSEDSTPSIAVKRIYNSEEWLRDERSMGAYIGMQGRVERIRERLWDMFASEVIFASKVCAGYGAPAKATTLLNYCKINNRMLKFIVDTTPAKQGRFIPGTGIPIITPVDAPTPDVYLLLSWNYAHEIIRANRSLDVSWLIPIPAPVVI